MIPSPENITIKDLYYTGELSVRSYNVCSRVNICTIQDLHEYLVNNDDFLRVKNCGAKSNKELLSLYKVYYLSNNYHGTHLPNTAAVAKPLEFDELIEKAYKDLSVRAKNALITYFKKKPLWHETVKRHFIERIFPINTLQNVGVKTAKEISTFIEFGKDLYYKFNKEQPSVCEKSRYELKQITGVTISENWIVEKYSEGKFPIISFSRQYFQQLFRLDEVESLTAQVLLGNSDSKLSLEEISQKADLTKERVRQKREKAVEKIEQSKILKALLENCYYKDIVANHPIVSVPNDITDADLVNECKENGSLFSAMILGATLSEQYYSLTQNDRLKRPSDIYSNEVYNKCKRVRGNYIIKHNVIAKSDIINLFNILFGILTSRHNEDDIVNLRDILPIEIKEETKEVLQKLLQAEYNLEMKDDIIIVKRNTPKLMYEHAEEALERIGKPAHIDDIVAEIVKYNPELDPSENGTKVAMQKAKAKFILFGRSSTFGLKKWELTSKHIKGGTIRDIVEEYLSEFDHPCHISDIAKHVIQFRKTDEYSIINNLKMTVEKRFTFSKNGMVGLASKNYNMGSKHKKIKLKDIPLDDLLSSIFLK